MRNESLSLCVGDEHLLRAAWFGAPLSSWDELNVDLLRFGSLVLRFPVIIVGADRIRDTVEKLRAPRATTIFTFF